MLAFITCRQLHNYYFPCKTKPLWISYLKKKILKKLKCLLDLSCKPLSDQNEKTLFLPTAFQTQPSHIFLLFLQCSAGRLYVNQGRTELQARSSCCFQEGATSSHPFLPCCVLLSLCCHTHWQTAYCSRRFLNLSFLLAQLTVVSLVLLCQTVFQSKMQIYLTARFLKGCFYLSICASEVSVLPLTCAEPTAVIRSATQPQDMHKLQFALSPVNFIFSKMSKRLSNSIFFPLLSKLQVPCFLNRAPANNINLIQSTRN